MSIGTRGRRLHGVVARRGLIDPEFLGVGVLAARCNQHEGLNLTFYLEHAESHPAHANQFLYYDAAEPVGVLTLQPGDPIEVCLAVHPEHRRKGIGQQLLDAAKAECIKRKLSRWYLVCEGPSQSGRAFVDAMGGRYWNSEYRMKFERGKAPLVSTRPGALRLHRADATEIGVLVSLMATSLGRAEDRVRERVLQDLQKPTHRFFIATLQGQPVGSLGVVTPGQYPYIVAFGVLPDLRGRGYGRQMLEEVVSILLAEGTQRILIEVETENEHALSLYRSCGFQEITSFGYYLMDF